ncbi:MAG: glycosyltransferase [Verrucomicrobia bacterium]|nr:glycosyltransferase [Verrucomicrobiota bacterium]
MATNQTTQYRDLSQPLVSVCIPAYNNGRFISATLQSVLRQTYDNLEIIVCDDHSADDTVEVARRCQDARILLLQNNTNLGMAGNWNKALAMAQGRYVKMMGADDMLYPDCIAKQVAGLEYPAHAEAVLAVCNTDVINAADRTVIRRRFRFRRGLVPGNEVIRKCVRWGANLVGEPVVGLFRRDLLPRSGMYRDANPYMLDVLFWAELLKHGPAFMDEERLVAFRISPGSASARFGWKQAAYTCDFVRRMHRDPFHRPNRLEVFCGHFLAFPRCILRNLLINLRSGPRG